MFINGKVITVDNNDTIAEAVAVRGDRIQKVGNEREIRTLIGPSTKVIDLQGKTMTPGIIDSHIHVLHYGRQFWEGFIDIRFPRVRSLNDLLKVVEDRAKLYQQESGYQVIRAFILMKTWTLIKRYLIK